MKNSSSNIKDPWLIILRAIFGLSLAATIVILVFVARRIDSWKYAESHAYKNVVIVSPTNKIDNH